jgi:hypothetical protein
VRPGRERRRVERRPAVLLDRTVHVPVDADDAGSTTFTLRTPGLDTAPAAGSVESIGFTFFQMLMMICSRETELNAVLGVHFVSSLALQNIEFIIEFAVGR